VAGKDDDLHAGIALLEVFQQLRSVHPGHFQIQQPDVESLVSGFLQGLDGVVEGVNFEVVLLQAPGHVVDELLLIVHEQKPYFVSHDFDSSDEFLPLIKQ
jgi:hypothetical protein